MGYLLDRTRALRVRNLVVVLAHRARGVRSRVILRDNSLYHTLTRPKTLIRRRPLGHGESPEAAGGPRQHAT